MPSRRASTVQRSRSSAGPRWTTEELADHLHSVSIHVLRRVRREDDRSGLSSPQLSALSVIVFAGPVTLSQLAAAEHVRPPTMTRVIDSLEREHLVRRTRDTTDKRMWFIAATAAGEALLHEGRKRRVAVLTSLLGRIGKSERKTVRDGVALLETVLAQAE